MKATKLISAAAAFFLATTAMAQESKVETDAVKKDNSPKTLMIFKNADFSGYGGLYTRYSKIGDADSCLVGARGGLIVNEKLVLGIAGMGLAYPTERDKISGDIYTGNLTETGFGYGGFLAEYYFNPKDLIVFSAGSLIGGGSLVFYEEHEKDNEGRHRRHGDNFFALEPELNVFVNVTRFCRIGTGIAYRYISGINSNEFSSKDFRGPSATFMVQLGWF